MFSLANVLWGLLLIGLGFLVVRYTFGLAGLTGRLDFIERYAGAGTTYAALKLLGVLAIFIGLLLVTGLGGPFFNLVLSPVKGIFAGFGSH